MKTVIAVSRTNRIVEAFRDGSVQSRVTTRQTVKRLKGGFEVSVFPDKKKPMQILASMD